MLLSGNATQGVAYSARGSQLGLLLSIPLLLFARFLFGENPGLGFYEESREILPWLLLGISSFLILTESTRLAWPKWMQAISKNWKINLFGREFDFSFSDSSNTAGIIAAGCFFLLSGFYGWAVFELPASSPVGLPGGASGGTMLMPGLAGLFGIANLIDIYVTTSEMPEQEENWEIPPAGPLIIPCFLSSICAAVMAILPGMTAAQATVVVMTVRNFFGKLRDPDYIPADFEFGPGQSEHPAVQAMARRKAMEDNAVMDPEQSSNAEEIGLLSDESGAMAVGGAPLSDEDLALLEDARKERAISPDLDLEAQTSQQDLEVIAILSATNTAVTVMVLAFLYLVGRPRSGAALALNMMYPIDPWSGVEPPPDFIKLIAVTVGAGLISVPIMLKIGKAMLKLHQIIPLRTLVLSVLIFIALLSWMTTGWIGMGVLITGTVLGLMPPRIGIRRSHGMGIILVPIMIYTFAAKMDTFGFT
jgi:putative membrane protein